MHNMKLLKKLIQKKNLRPRKTIERKDRKEVARIFLFFWKIIKLLKNTTSERKKNKKKERNEFMNYLIVYGADKALKF